ncbi:MAG: phosphoenolpyruvate--protein phosphotransferase [Mycoplasmataceae bacterium]|nr:phosphoenolpyruvate--protein phosphotransferase [Mycoplasmataceae bacterium]
MIKINGISGFEGIVIATAFVFKKKKYSVKKDKVEDIGAEIRKFEEANFQIKKELLKIKQNIDEEESFSQIKELNFQIDILENNEINNQIKNVIFKNHFNASYAVNLIFKKFSKLYLSMNDQQITYFEKCLLIIEEKLICNLQNILARDLSSIYQDVILIVKDDQNIESFKLNNKFIKGYISESGTKISKMAIFTKSFSIPSILGINNDISKIVDGQNLILNSFTGEIIIDPTSDQKILAQNKINNLIKDQKDLLIFKKHESRTKDNHQLNLSSSINDPKQLKGLLTNEIGYIKTDFLYNNVNALPSEEQQFVIYKKIIQKAKHRKVNFETFGIENIHEMNYLKFNKIQNPSLGKIAIRLQLENPNLFEAQIRALLRASQYGDISITIPMITYLDEIKLIKKQISIIEKKLLKEEVLIGDYKLGISIEIPSVVIMLDKFVKYVDFVIIKTDNLIQYSFGIDKNATEVAHLYQPFNPAFIRKLNVIITTVHLANKKVIITGDIVDDELFLLILIGLNFINICMNPTSFLKIKKAVINTNKKEAYKLVKKILKMESEEEVISLLKNHSNNY